MEAGLVSIAKALAFGLAAIGTGIAQARIGSAAVGGVIEKPEMFGLIIVFMALPELLVILGFAAMFIIV